MSRRIKPQSVALQPRNVFHRRTCGLTLPPDHDVYDDQDCYHEFDDIFRELSPARGQFRQSDHAVWYSKTLLFKNFQQSLYQTVWGTRIWDQFSACSVSTAVKELRTALKSETKDIAFVCGGPVWVTDLDGTVKKSGHAVTIVLTKDKYGNRVLIQKDPLPKDEVTARAKCYDIASGLGIRTIQVIPMQLDESTSECLLESYRFLAKVLDGKFIRGYENFEKRIYSVSERKPLSDKFIIG